jgi:hypothetical protein
MDVKLTVAISTAVLFGALSAGLFIENTHLQVKVHQQSDALANQQKIAADQAAMLKKLFSGKSPPGQDF